MSLPTLNLSTLPSFMNNEYDDCCDRYATAVFAKFQRLDSAHFNRINSLVQNWVKVGSPETQRAAEKEVDAYVEKIENSNNHSLKELVSDVNFMVTRFNEVFQSISSVSAPKETLEKFAEEINVATRALNN